MANFTLQLNVGVTKGAGASWFYVQNSVGHSYGNPVDVEIGDTVTFTRTTSSNGTGYVKLLNIFTNNADVTLTASAPTVVRTIATGGTTLDAIRGEGTVANHGTDDFFLERQAAPSITAPTASSVTFNNPASANTTATVNLSASGSGGTLQYACEVGDSTPDNWQSGSTFTISRGSGTVYARARRSSTDLSNVVSATRPGFLTGDTSVSATSSTITTSAGNATTTISSGTAGETYAVRLNNGSSNLATRTGNGTVLITTSLPSGGNTTTYEVFVRRPTSTGGDGTTYYPTNDTFTVTRSADTTAPVITVTGANPATVLVGGSYTDAGATANGGETVSSSGTVNTSVVGAYTITYSATDSANNTGTATRTVNVVDTTAPVITRLGSATVTLNVGGTYSDAGATAIDNVDGTITSSIVTVNPVNVNAAGTYTVTYNVSDAAGNAATQVTRSVTVYAVPDINITQILNKTEPFGSTTFVATIASGSSTTVYEVKDFNTNPATGTVHASQTGNGDITVSDMPSAGSSKLYMITGRVTAANGGDNTPFLAETFEVFQQTSGGTSTGGGGSGTYGIRVRNASNEIILDVTDRVVILRQRVTGSIPAADLTKNITLSGTGTCALNLALPTALQSVVNGLTYSNTHLIVWATISGTTLTINRKFTNATNVSGSSLANAAAPYDFLVIFDPET